MQEKSLEVKIPAGVTEDTLMSVAGQGNIRGAHFGDLLLSFKVRFKLRIRY